MTKKQVQKRIIQNGKPLALNKFKWDDETKTLSTKESDLQIDFADIGYCTFTTGESCTFKTGGSCTFKTGWYCTFKTGCDCTFTTDGYCTFTTDGYCTFMTGCDCKWIIDGNEYAFAPLCISGSVWDVFYNAPGKVGVGCETHTITEFKSKAKALAKSHKLDDAQLAEYRGLLDIIEAWGALKGWN